jgi:archaellum biogenesis ATPase FlaH
MQNLKLINMEDVEREYVSWLMKPYIPFGKITIVQGDPGEGKTTVMLAIAAALTKGEALPLGETSKPMDVIFQTAEDGLADTIKPRLEELGADCSRVHVIDESEKQLSFSDERIEQAIVKTNAKLLILDPAQAYFQGSSMNSADGVRPMMKILAGVAERTDCAIVIIGHLNKSKGKSQYRGLGSIDIYAAARSVLVVGRIGEYTRAIVQDKSNLAPPGKSLSFELDPALGFKWCGECDATVDDVMRKKSNRETQNEKAIRIILEVLGNGDEVAANELYAEAREGGISEKTLKRTKSELGVISTKKGDAWYWRLPIEAKFTETQQGQEGQTTEMTSLTLLETTTESERNTENEN